MLHSSTLLKKPSCTLYASQIAVYSGISVHVPLLAHACVVTMQKLKVSYVDKDHDLCLHGIHGLLAHSCGRRQFFVVKLHVIGRLGLYVRCDVLNEMEGSRALRMRASGL